MKGKFVAKRTVTEFNTISKKIKHVENLIEYDITKIDKNHYLMKQYQPSKNETIYILFVKSANGYISSSYASGIDNLFIDDSNNLVHSWSDKINSEGVLINAYAILKKV